MMDKGKSRINEKKFAPIVVVLVVVVMFVVGYLSIPREITEVGDGYQAVFLTNGQVYFGKIKSLDNISVKMENIYYLQTQIKVQPADISNANFNLVKLGSELHGPEDQMFISRAQVLFWENLKADSKVARAIKEYK